MSWPLILIFVAGYAVTTTLAVWGMKLNYFNGQMSQWLKTDPNHRGPMPEPVFGVKHIYNGRN